MADQESGDALFAALDADGGLIGRRHVCSGTARMIGQMWDALAGGDAVLPEPWASLNRRVAELTELAELLARLVRQLEEADRTQWTPRPKRVI